MGPGERIWNDSPLHAGNGQRSRVVFEVLDKSSGKKGKKEGACLVGFGCQGFSIDHQRYSPGDQQGCEEADDQQNTQVCPQGG